MNDPVSKPIAPELIERKYKRDPFVPVYDQLAPYRDYAPTDESRRWEPVT